MARPQPLGDPFATQVASGVVSFDDDGHVGAEFLNGLVEGQLRDSMREQVLAHLSACDRCRHVVAELGMDATVRHDTTARTAEFERATPSDVLIGTTLGEYDVLEKLSEGGMGAVYRGLQPVIGKSVAIKVLLPAIANDADHSHRLLAEARAVNAIRHPNIVDIFGFGTLPDGRQYFVMELLAGQPLSALLRAAGRLEVPEVLIVLEQTMNALSAVHAAGVVHRDLKPSNLFVTPLAEGLHTTVLDFGVAKGIGKPIAGASTLPGAVIGTPGFMAPEQIKGIEVGPPADVYAMGAVTFLLLTGTEPFSAEADIDLLRLHVSAELPSLSSRGVHVPPALESLVASMLAKAPVDRPTAVEVRRKASRLRQDIGGSGATQHVRRSDLTPLTNEAQTRGTPDPKTSPTPLIVRQTPGPTTSPDVKTASAPVPAVERKVTDSATPAVPVDAIPKPSQTLVDARAVTAPRVRPVWLVLGGLALIASSAFVARRLLAREPVEVPNPPVYVEPVAPDPTPPEPLTPVDERPTETATPPPPTPTPTPKPPVAGVRKVQPRGPTRDQVSARLGDANQKASKLKPGVQRIVRLQLEDLSRQLERGVTPGKVSGALEQLVVEYNLDAL